MNKEIFGIITALCKEKNIKEEILVEAVEAALLSAAQKKLGDSIDLEVSIGEDGKEICVFLRKKVVRNVRDTHKEIGVKEAKEIDRKLKVGSIYVKEITPHDFGRIAAQTAKQVIIQKIRDVENENLYEKFRERQGTLINGVVYRFDYGDVIIDLGDAEARMPYRERLQNERYRQGDRIRAYILEVADTGSKVKIIVSRTHPEFVRRLLELEVPEITQNIVEIKAIAREPGDRTKIAVYSNKENVDCVGACVGIKGTRIKAVIEELAGERIDVIEWNKDLKTFIRKALAPAEIKGVKLDEENKAATILVDPDQLAIAIGKKGQNVKLTSRLVNCRIDIVADEKKEERGKIDIPGIGKGIIGILETHGYDTMSKLSKISVKNLLKLPGIGIKTAAKIKMLK